jgi:uncharacterized protein (TIGR03067 family)
MSIFLSLSTFALRQVIGGACEAVGVKDSGEAVVGFLTERFTDHSQRLTKALQQASDNAWKALEVSLAGDSLWDRCKVLVARGENQAFAQQVRAFLDAAPLPQLAGKTTFRQKCLEELRAARKARTLTGDKLNPRQLARQTAEFARFGDPTSLVEAEWRMAVSMADEMKQAGYSSLAWLLSKRPRQGMPVLVVAVRYFFRRAVEEDQKLFQGLAFAKLEALGEAQEKGFASLSAALAQQGERLEELLSGVQAVVVQTHSAVLDLQGQMKGHGEQIEQIGQAVMKLLEQHRLQRREVRPGDSLSIRNEGERQLVKQLVARYRSLPQGERQNVPSLLNAIGKLEVVAGEFDQAQRDFQQVATMVDDTRAKAEAHFNAYQTALERRDFDAALKEFIEAVKVDAKRYAPFPVGKYHPLRILGAGGFGTAFLCRHKYMSADVVVKALHLDALGRDTDKVFTEAQVLRQLDHPAIIRISECGYVDAASKARPHIIMDYFQGQTLESYVKEHGRLPVEDMLPVARQVAEALQAAHGAKILHRDVKPANLLVRKEATGWKVKIIDFGLAMPQKVVQTSQKGSTVRQKETMIGSSIAGTLDYGAPEQMGKRKEPVGPYSDVYGWAKTCCYALFQTTQPLMKHWKSVPEPLAELLEKCLEEDPKQRPARFAEVLKGLDTGVASSASVPVVPERGFDFERPEREAVHAPRGRTTRKPPKKSLLPWVLGGVGLLTVLLLGLVVMFLRSAPKPVEVAGKEDGRNPSVVKPVTKGEDKNPANSSNDSPPPIREKPGEPTKPGASGPKVPAPEPKDDRAILQGRWYAVSEGSAGEEAIIAMNKIMDATGDRMRIERTHKGKRGVYDGTFRLEPTATPKRFDWEGTAVGGQVELHGIYELTEDTFKVCYMIVPKGATYTRPNDYSTPGNSRVNITFKRSPLKVGRPAPGTGSASNTPPPPAAEKTQPDRNKSPDKDESKKDGPPAKVGGQTRKDEYSVGKGTLVITTTVVDDRRVRFVFVARNFGNDYLPLTNWINTNQGFYRRKLEELGLGTGAWQQTNLTWPPKLGNEEATFDVTFERK